MRRLWFVIFTKFFAGNQKSFLRAAMRGYRKLRSDGNLGLILTINQDLTNTFLDIKPLNYDKIFFLTPSRPVELIIRQYLLQKIIKIKNNKSIYASYGSNKFIAIAAGMPREWCDVLNSHGLNINYRACEILFKFKCILFLLQGCALLSRAICTGLFKPVSKDVEIKDYAWFNALNETNIPRNPDGHTILNWYGLKYSHITKVNLLCHSVNSVKADLKASNNCNIRKLNPIENCSNFLTSLALLSWGLNAVKYSIADLLCSSGYRSAIFPEAVKAAIVRFSQKYWKMKHAMFHQTGFIYRPLWTYEAEDHGSLISLYFYSTNNNLILPKAETKRINYGWEAMNWPHYLTWNKTQAEFIYHAIGQSANIEIVGPIYFSDSPVKSNLPAKQGEFRLAAFDVQPHRLSTYQLLGAEYEYYVAKTAILFLQALENLAESFNIVIYFKQKREIGKTSEPSYRNQLKKLLGKTWFKFIDPSVSAESLINVCDSAISMPFTSTAIIADSMHKPSAYYDSTGELDPFDNSSNGLPLLTSYESLSKWLELQLSMSC